MNLTPEQLATLKAAILAETDPAFVEARTAGAEQPMADWHNAPSAFVVWLLSVDRDAVTVEGFDWTQVDNLTPGQGRIWDLLFDTQTKTINPSEPGKRAAISECWKGTNAKVAVATFVLGKCRRSALRGERVFSTGVGSDAAPGMLTLEGSITAQNISDALRA